MGITECDLDSRLLTHACRDFAKIVKQIPGYKTELINKLSWYDQAKSDLEHEIELAPLSASERSNRVNRLREVLQGRRKIKDSLEVIRRLEELKIPATAERINEFLQKQEVRYYKPRVLKDLKIGRVIKKAQ